MSLRQSFKLHTVMFLWVAPFLLGAASVCAYLTYERVHDAIIQGFDRKLSAAALTTAVFFDGRDHVKLMSLAGEEAENGSVQAEDTRLYQKYSQPMQRIMRESGLTYHYTITLKEESQITYGVDATEGDEHSFLGTDEENPPEESRRLLRSYKNASLSVSPIQQFDIWGKLKIANAPILDEGGKVVALTGADVNISVIDQKTRAAFLQVLGAGILSLMLAAVLTWFAARRIALPLQKLKSSALRIGGGEFTEQVSDIGQAELRQLGLTLENLGNSLQGLILKEELKQQNEICQTDKLLTECRQSHEELENILMQAGKASKKRLEILKNSPLFHFLSLQEMLVVAQASSTAVYRPDALICEKGEIPAYVYLIIRGDISGDSPSVIPGIIGLESLLFDRPLTEDLRASSTEGAHCLVLKKEHFLTLINECPAILSGLIERQTGGQLI